MLRRFLAPTFALFALAPACAFAQTASPGSATAVREATDDRWSIGVAVAAQDSPYAGEGTRVRPLPFIGYEGARVYWRGITFGVHLLESDSFTLDGVIAARLDGFDDGDLGCAALARNGVDIDRLHDRDHGLDAGLAARWRMGSGELRLQAVADVTGASDGYELSADYGHRFHVGRTVLIPGIGVQWQSDDLADYYYGVDAAEMFSGAGYRPGSALVPRATLAFGRPLAGAWRMQGVVQYERLPDALTDSPLLEHDARGVAKVMIGVVRGF